MKKSAIISAFGVVALCFAFVSFTGFSSTNSRPQQLVYNNLLQNGSFDDGPVGLGLKQSAVPGWYVWMGTVDVIPNAPSAQFSDWHQSASGTKSLELIGTPGVGGIAQNIQTEVGKKYVFSGWLSHHPGIWEAGVWVWIDDRWLEQPLFHNTPNTKADMKWKPFSIEFTAKSSQTLIGLLDQNRVGWDFGGAVIDGLSITLADNSPSLPPDPGEEGKKTLAGIDSDQDGVRDDVQRWIYFQFPNSQKKRAALRQIAIDFQAVLLSSADKDRTIEAMTKYGYSLGCGRFVLGADDDESQLKTSEIITDVEIEFLNTSMRSDAYIRANQHCSGQIFHFASEKEGKNACAFSLADLQN